MPKNETEIDRAVTLQRARIKRQESWLKLETLRVRERELLDELRNIRARMLTIFGLPDK